MTDTPERDFDLAAVDRAVDSVLDRGPTGYGSYDDLLERCEKAARALEHQAALEPVEVMAARLRGKAQGVRLAVSFLAEAHQSGHPDWAFALHHSGEEGGL